MNSERNFSIVHIHPTLNCNLRCLHCYSNSEPNLKLGLELNSLLPYLKYLKENHQFNVISISGGEPFLYSDLKKLLFSTKELGYYNQVVSNGMLLKSKKNIEILNYIDSIAISIDGDKELHNEIRASKFAFDKMLEGVKILREKKIPFGFIHTVTKKSWQKIPDLIELISDLGGNSLQLHPIESTGRAIDELNNDYFLSQEDLHRIFILSSIIKETSPIKIQLDLLHKHFIEEHPEIVFGNINEINTIKDLLKEIIITEKGDILPISYGFSHNFLIHNLQDNNTYYNNSIEKFLNDKGERLKKLITHTYNSMITDDDKDLFNWGELIVEESKKETWIESSRFKGIDL